MVWIVILLCLTLAACAVNEKRVIYHPDGRIEINKKTQHGMDLN